MADDSDVLLTLIKEQRDQVRQIEAQRALLSNLVIVVVAAGLGFIAHRGISTTILTITVPMALLGAYGVLACLKYHERSRLHGSQAHQLRLQLTELHPRIDLDAGWTQVFTEQRAQFPLLYRLRLYLIWVSLHAGICIGGLAMTIAALSR
ncbi:MULTISPECIES: hypothetical protein [unclassified Streptomyces]|uniref:hypothetical protein n=1 Tax=unclassified Streptomyces TaxID=2593676 RepID=UPI002DD9B7B3|nr:hypothetical protein [Streptomyces sp. NBC_01257]WRZ63272.1 hypothetical protein OG408_05010 [Streptomyces sp. NBC_01257]WSU57247.1 hypothetical protein OG450_05015 [Streptomyces sp. NBC_01104]